MVEEGAPPPSHAETPPYEAMEGAGVSGDAEGNLAGKFGSRLSDVSIVCFRRSCRLFRCIRAPAGEAMGRIVFAAPSPGLRGGG